MVSSPFAAMMRLQDVTGRVAAAVLAASARLASLSVGRLRRCSPSAAQQRGCQGALLCAARETPPAPSLPWQQRAGRGSSQRPHSPQAAAEVVGLVATAAANLDTLDSKVVIDKWLEQAVEADRWRSPGQVENSSTTQVDLTERRGSP